MKIMPPNRATRSYTQHLVADAERVFPLLCPVREADWIEGWDPLLVVSESGVAEPDCVFVTAGESTNDIWYVTRHDAATKDIEMIKVTPGVTACRLSIKLADAGEGCTATISYSHTSLGPAGDRFIAGFTEEFYAQFMRDWEQRMNRYLQAHPAR